MRVGRILLSEMLVVDPADHCLGQDLGPGIHIIPHAILGQELWLPQLNRVAIECHEHGP